jgi:diacylglycerol kinase (ATP)
MQETLFIINPVSNRGTTVRFWNSARPELLKAGIQISEQFTTRAGEAITLTREAITNGVQLIIAVGGDGTINEVVNGYLDKEGQAINPQAGIGILPSGTGSDFRRSVGLLRQEDAIRAIRHAEPRLMDAMQVDYQDREGKSVTRFALNMVSLGLGGEVVRYVNDWRDRLPDWIGGRARFVGGVLRALSHYNNKQVMVVVDNGQAREIRSNVIFAANGRYAGGGMMFAPHAALDDGLIDLILADGASRFDIMKELPRIFHGAHLNNPKVKEIKALSLLFLTDEKLAVDIDGEAAGYAPVAVRVLPRVVRFLC